MTAITLRFPLTGNIRIDTGLLYLTVVSLNIFILALIYTSANQQMTSALILVTVNSFFNGLFVRSLFDATFNEARNLLNLSLALFIVTCIFPPFIAYSIASIMNIHADIIFLLAVNIYLNALSPLWTPKRYLRMILICVVTLAALITDIYVFKHDNVLNLLIAADILLVSYLAATEFRRKYGKSFKITRFYIFLLLSMGGITNFAMHFIIIFTALRCVAEFREVLLSMLPVFVPLTFAFAFQSDIEHLTYNVIRGSLAEIKEIYRKIHTVYTKYTAKCAYSIALLMIILLSARHLGLITDFIVILSSFYLFSGLSIFSLKYLEIYHKCMTLITWIVYLAFYISTLIYLGDLLYITVANVAFSIAVTWFALSRNDADEGIRHLCRYNLKYAWGG